jgi:hypothetical protein
MADDYEEDYGASEDAIPDPTVRLGDEPPEPPLTYDQNSPNLMPDFMASEEGRAFVRKIVKKVLREHKTSWDSTEEYRAKMNSNWDIFRGTLKPKDPPYTKMANAHVPIMFEAITRLYFRARAELFGDWTNVMGVQPVGPDDKEVARILTLHGNWQIRNQIPDFKRQMHRGLLTYIVVGDVTTHSYYDKSKRRNVHEVLTPNDFTVPFLYTSVQPDYSDCPFKSKILKMYRHEVQRMRDDWYGIEKVLERKPPSVTDDPVDEGRLELAAVQGEDIPDDVKNLPYKFISHAGYCEFPGDDYDRQYLAVVDMTTETCVKLFVLEEEDWQDRLRFDQESMELDQYRQASATYQQMIPQMQAQEQELELRMQQPGVDPAEVEMMRQGLAASPMPPPPPPKWTQTEGEEVDPDDPMTAPRPTRWVPIEMFTHTCNVEPIFGSLGLGLGMLEADLNRAANVALSQFTDSATLANIWSIITTDIEFAEEFEIAPGHQNKAIGVSAEQLHKSIYELKPSPANSQLMELVNFMTEFAQSSAQAPQVLSGEPGKSGETYRGIATRIEQATKQLSESTRGYGDGTVLGVLRNNAKLNALYLPDEEIIQINNHKLGSVEEITVGKKLYQRDYRVELRSDLRFTSDAQRVQEADEALSLAVTVPALQNNLSYWWQACKNCLESRNQWELLQRLGPEPPPPAFFGGPTAIPGMGILPGAPMGGGQQAPGQQAPEGPGGGEPRPSPQGGGPPVQTPPGPGGAIAAPPQNGAAV